MTHQVCSLKQYARIEVTKEKKKRNRSLGRFVRYLGTLCNLDAPSLAGGAAETAQPNHFSHRLPCLDCPLA